MTRSKMTSRRSEIWIIFTVLILHNLWWWLRFPVFLQTLGKQGFNFWGLWLAGSLASWWLDQQNVELAPWARSYSGWVVRLGLAIATLDSGPTLASLACVISLILCLGQTGQSSQGANRYAPPIGQAVCELASLAGLMLLRQWVFADQFPSMKAGLTSWPQLACPLLAGLLYFALRQLIWNWFERTDSTPNDQKIAYSFLWKSSRTSEAVAALSLALVTYAAQGTIQAPSPIAYLALSGCLGVLYLINRGLANEIFRVQSKIAHKIRQESKQKELEIERLFRLNDQTRAELEATQKQRNSLENLTRLLSQTADLTQLAQVLLQTLQTQVQLESCVIFEVFSAQISPDTLIPASSLVPVFVASPLKSQLEKFVLTNVSEPLLSTALAQRKPVVSTAQFDSSSPLRFFSTEKGGAAIPFGQRHLLYVGRSNGYFSAQDAQWMLWVAMRGAPALDSLLARLRQAQELVDQTRMRRQLETEKVWLNSLLNLAQVLPLKMQLADIQEVLGQSLAGLMAYDSALVVLWDCECLSWGPSQGLEQIQLRVQTVQQTGKPLLYETQPGGWAQSLLVVPILAASSTPQQTASYGAIALAARSPHQYQRLHQDLLFFLATQLAVFVQKNQILQQLNLSQKQLLQSSKMAAIGQLAAGVAHELNTPLGAVRLLLDRAQIQITKAPAEANQKLERALKALGKAQNIIEKLLTYSASGSAQTVLSPEPMIDEVQELLEPQFKKQRVQFVRATTNNSAQASFLGNSNEIQQILVNLAINACDAVAESHSPRVEIGWQPHLDTGTLEFWVKDQGPGIPPQTLERIFEPFFTTKEVGQGTGLGLSISQKLAEQNGGNLLIESAVGQGTQAYLRFPLVQLPNG